MTQISCSTCDGPGIPVVWGKPGARTLLAAERGLVRAGGCIVRGTPGTTWWCPACLETFIGSDTSAAISEATAGIENG